jgi:hypothetical protein
MEKITINIKSEDKDANFASILLKYGFNGLIPSNTFINKVRPGIGGTTVELLANRHSIIIEPYVTVMEVKKNVFVDRLCIVMDGIHNKDIEDYLNDSSIIYKKIMTTPEGFPRMIKALKTYDSQFRKNFFLLYDESDKLVEQSLFRSKLLDPLSELFEFDQKAFISATLIIPSDERLDEQGFKILEFLPEWDYKKDIKVITTDNIRTTLRNQIGLYNDDKPVFIFTNCKQSILYMARLEAVSIDYKVFCAEKLNEEFFKHEEVLNVEHSVSEQKYAKYNFFTSRFFSAVDMFYDGKDKPHIIMVTNIPNITHSLIFPATQAIQIQGRCRNGVSSITHVTNLYLNRDHKSNEAIQKEIELSIFMIDKLKSSSLAFHHKSVQTVVSEIIGKEFASVIYNDEGTINSYFKDAYIHQQEVENCYTSAQTLIKAYEDSNYFKVEHRNVQHVFSDQDILKLNLLRGRRKSIALVEYLEELEFKLSTGIALDEDEIQDFNRLIENQEIIFRLYCEYGKPFLESIKFHKSKMKSTYQDLIFRQRKENNYSNMIDTILLKFKLNVRINSEIVKLELQNIYDHYQYTKGNNTVVKAKGPQMLDDYFECKHHTGKKKHPIHGYKSFFRLSAAKFKLSNDLKVLER